MKFLTLFLVCIIALAADAVTKKWQLTMLALVPQLPEEVHGGVACELSMQVAINNVNNRSDILPDYHLNVIYGDEGEDVEEAKGNALKNFFRFINHAEENRSNSNTISPIFVGTVSPNGCSFIGAFAHLYNMVGIAIGCNLPTYTANRRMFPNYYRSSMSDETALFPVVKFVKEVGKWSRIAIVSSAYVDYDYIMASYAYNVLSSEGIHVVWFNAYPAIDDNFASLKTANVRIIAIFLLQIDLLFITLCRWYEVGIRPENGFVFIFRGNMVLEENEMFSVFQKLCPREIMMSQLQSAFFVGAIEFPNVPSDSMSTLGYDLFSFDVQLDALVRQHTPVPMRFLRGFPLRTRCHDTMLEAIMALDSAEKKLRGKNLTLTDYNVYPGLVADVVNQSVASINYSGIRGTGQTWYSERLEYDNEPQQIKQWYPGTYGFGKLLYKVYKFKQWPFNSSSFVVQKFQNPFWVFSTKPGEPPNDSWGIQISLVTARNELWLFVVIFATLLSSLQFGVSARTIWLIAKNSQGQQINRPLLLLGCLVNNAAAVCFIYERGRIMCAFRFILMTIGFSFLNGAVFFKLAVIFFGGSSARPGSVLIRLRSFTRTVATRKRRTSQRPSTLVTVVEDRAARPSSTFSTEHNQKVSVAPSHSPRYDARWVGRRWSTTTPRQPDPTFEKWQDKLTFVAIIVFVLVNAAILLAWFLKDRPQVMMENYTKEPKYNRATDTYIYEKVTSCNSGNQKSWIGALTALHGCILLLSLFLSYDLRRWKANAKSCVTSDLQNTRVAAINSAVMLVAVVIILFVLTVPLVQHEIVSLSMLLHSSLITLIMFLIGKHLKANCSVESDNITSAVPSEM